MKRLASLAGAVAIATVTLLAPPAIAEGAYVTGVNWKASSKSEKLAYVLGISNLMSADYELQRKGGRARGSAISEMYGATANVSVEKAVATIDAWFAANPDKMDDTVLDVIWMTLVER
jgi:hypothetical protein